MSERFNAATQQAFNLALHDLVQMYLEMTDVDPLALSIALRRHADMAQVIGVEERRKFHDAAKLASSTKKT